MEFSYYDFYNTNGITTYTSGNYYTQHILSYACG